MELKIEDLLLSHITNYGNEELAYTKHLLHGFVLTSKTDVEIRYMIIGVGTNNDSIVMLDVLDMKDKTRYFTLSKNEFKNYFIEHNEESLEITSDTLKEIINLYDDFVSETAWRLATEETPKEVIEKTNDEVVSHLNSIIDKQLAEIKILKGIIAKFESMKIGEEDAKTFAEKPFNPMVKSSVTPVVSTKDIDWFMNTIDKLIDKI